MWIPNESEIKSAGEFLGICGTVFTSLKAIVGYLTDRSLERKKEKTLDEIEICTDRIHKFDETKELAQEPGMREYRHQLTGDLSKKLQTLNVVTEKSRERDAKRDDDPKGVRGWLLLYRPDGLDGWIVHSLFYFSVLMCLTFISIVPKSFREQRSSGLLDFFFDFLLGFLVALSLFSAFALYLRGVSRRLRTVAGEARKNGGKDANADLKWWRKAALAFKIGHPSLIRTFYYLAVFISLVTLLAVRSDYRFNYVVRMSTDSETMSLNRIAHNINFRQIVFDYSRPVSLAVLMMMIAEALRADVLARRALSKFDNARCANAVAKSLPSH
jgi:hypothetical protein